MNITGYKEKNFQTENMKKLILHILGMLQIDSQIILYSNFRDIQTIMKMVTKNIKHCALMMKVLNCLLDILLLLLWQQFQACGLEL